MAAKAVFSADDVLKGKVDLDALDTSHVFVYGKGLGRMEKLLEAVNVMVKFGWRARGINEQGILLERQE